MSGNQSPGLFRGDRSQVGNKLENIREGKIVRRGVLRIPSDSEERSVPYLHKEYEKTDEEIIAERAIEMGCEEGDIVRYNIIIYPRT